jgi:hypothetical protein
MPGDPGDEHGNLPLRSPAGNRDEPELEEAFDRIIDEGRDRLGRPLLPLVATGLLGGVDVQTRQEPAKVGDAPLR